MLGCGLAPQAAGLIAGRARGTPRVANRLLSRSRVSIADAVADGVAGSGKGKTTVTEALAQKTLRMLEIDDHGLDAIDRRILRVIADHGGQPVGLKTIAIAIDEEDETVEMSTTSRYLIQQGLLSKTPRGRLLTDRGTRLAIAAGAAPARVSQPDLFSR